MKHIVIKKDLAQLTTVADQYQLSEVWLILLDNAIKYSPKKSTIYVKMKKDGKCANVTITDQGIGIKDTEIKQIFDRFYRADSARSKQKGNGFGLGLAIAKKIVEQHYGKISVKSVEKKGTNFIVKLPLKS